MYELYHLEFGSEIFLLGQAARLSRSSEEFWARGVIQAFSKKVIWSLELDLN